MKLMVMVNGFLIVLLDFNKLPQFELKQWAEI